MGLPCHCEKFISVILLLWAKWANLSWAYHATVWSNQAKPLTLTANAPPLFFLPLPQKGGSTPVWHPSSHQTFTLVLSLDCDTIFNTFSTFDFGTHRQTYPLYCTTNLCFHLWGCGATTNQAEGEGQRIHHGVWCSIFRLCSNNHPHGPPHLGRGT